ncbi:MAG: circularly permuted type 2 ATP-grasp protein [Steroidobacteraceae bacterium]
MTENWLGTYRARARRYDELRDASGQVREHWRPLVEHLSGMGAAAAGQGVSLARTLIAENGVTYNVYADPKGADRPWVLDALPLVLTASEWQGIERGVQQRAQLLNALLADLYGPQRMLAEGIIPPELAFGHPNFLWPCHGVTPVGGYWLPIYAVDLARAPDGQWWVLGDRTQTPSGAGYALENRQIISRVFPELIRDLDVRNVNAFFVALREQLLSAADQGEAPLAVVLTPGALNETYFEHAYLARQLGMLLVEGHDLTVRNDTVYLKTLGGLRRVHAILRRLDDDFCDPVELRSDSALGVPGLLQAVRAGRVMLANPLGSGVLQSAAWMGFLPGVAEWLLGESLHLPSVATWWCGERPALDYVFKNIDQLVIKPAFPNQRYELAFGKELEPRQREELFERMRKRPHAYVAQERFALSQAPVWRMRRAGLRLSARAVSLRVYAIATAHGYRVLPGGLARIAGETSADVVSGQYGGGSKDVWVLSDKQAVMAAEERRALPRMSVKHLEVPSSLGESLFWLGRYHERCENKVRLARSTLTVRSEREVWESALQSCREMGLAADSAGLRETMFDASHFSSLAADCNRLHWCATQVRGRLSLEHWRTIGLLRRQIKEAMHSTLELHETLDWLLLSLAALSGFSMDDLTQDDGWRLMLLGRRLERMQFLSDLLAERLHGGLPLAQGELEWLLDINGCTIAYRSRYQTSPRLGLVLDLLLRDPANPRSVSFQRRAIRQELLQLAEIFDVSIDAKMNQPIGAVLDADFGVLEGDGQGASYARQHLAARLQELSAAVRRVSDDLSLRHFSHVEREQRMVET